MAFVKVALFDRSSLSIGPLTKQKMENSAMDGTKKIVFVHLGKVIQIRIYT